MAKRAFLLSLLVAISGLHAACNSAGGTLARIKKDKKTFTGAVPFEPPLLYQDRQALVGPEAMIAQRIAEKMAQEVGLPGEIEPFWITRTYKTLAPALANDEIDFVVSVFGITEARKKIVDFSDSYYTSELALVINPGHRDLRADDLDNQRIGVREGTAAEERITQKYPNSTVVPLSTIDDAVLALKRGEVDAVIDDHLLAAYSLATAPGVGSLEVVPGAIDTVECAVAVRKGESRVLALVNEVVAEAKKDGQYQKWIDEHMKDYLVSVDQRHPKRLEEAKRAAQPRQVTISIARGRGSSFDIYRFANLNFVLTELNSGQSYTTSRIDFRGSTGYASVSVPPGNYRVFLSKFNFTAGSLLVRSSDANQVRVDIRIGADGTFVMSRS